MEIIVKIIEALAWPITVLILFLIFKSEVSKIFTRLSNLKYKDFEAKFGNQLNDVEEGVKTLEISVFDNIKVEEKIESKMELNFNRLSRLSEISPRAAITEAWIEVENAAKFAAEEIKLRIKHPHNVMNIIRELITERVCDEKAAGIFNKLQCLRNEAAHAPDFVLSQNDAEKYIDLSLRLAHALYNVRKP